MRLRWLGRGVSHERFCTLVEEYLATRRALGAKLEKTAMLLRGFVNFAARLGAVLLTVELALSWATAGLTIEESHNLWQRQSSDEASTRAMALSQV